MQEKESIIGKTAAVLIMKSGADEKAVVTSIVAQCRRKQSRKRLFFSGQARFDSKTEKHVNTHILPIIDRILEALKPDTKQKAYELSIVNLSVASVMDKGVDISGFSADIAVFLALLSATFNIPLAQNFVATGHIASSDGDIKAVSGLSEKITAACETDGIKKFIYPALESDISRKNWQNEELQAERALIPYARQFMKMIHVDSISQTLKEVFNDRELVIASMEGEFFHKAETLSGDENCLSRIVYYLTGDNENRFWDNFTLDALNGNAEHLRQLLVSRIKYQIKNKHYPKGFGRKLLQMILSVPGAIRRTALTGELVDIELYFKLCQYADKEDLKKDSRYLRDVLEGRAGQLDTKQILSDSIEITEGEISKADLEDVFLQISEEQISKKISRPIDNARAIYILERITVDSAEQFLEQITSFYIHLISHTALAPAQIDTEQLQSSALQLLQRAFANNGGVEAARQEALDGYAGGMNLILNQITDQFKFEQKTGYVNSILTRMVDQTDIVKRIEFTKKLLEYIGTFLPAEIRDRPASTLIDRYQEIIKAYVSSIDRLKQSFRQF